MLLQEESPVEVRRPEMSNRPFIIGLVGVVLYVVGTLLPYVTGAFQGGPARGISPSSILAVTVGVGLNPPLPVRTVIEGVVVLYGVAIGIAMFAMAGIRSRRKPRWERPSWPRRRSGPRPSSAG